MARGPYQFGALPWAGWLASWAGSGPDLARPGQIRPVSPFLFLFLCLIQMLFMCCALNQFKNVLSLKKL
jgi:hypothetical protein